MFKVAALHRSVLGTLALWLVVASSQFFTALGSEVENATQLATESDVNRLSRLIAELLESSEDFNPSLILRDFVKHPLAIRNFSLNIAGAAIECYDVWLNGLNTVELIDATANISGQRFLFSLAVPLVQLTGHQQTSGYVSIVPLDARGRLELNVSDVRIAGNAMLRSSPEAGLRIDSVRGELEIGDASLFLEGLSELTQSLLNFAGREIFDYTKESMLADFEQAVTRYANEQLLKKIPVDFANFDMDQLLIDSIVKQACELLRRSGHDPLQLKPYEASANQPFLQCEIRIANATLQGLSTLRRRGDVVALYANRSIIFEASFGFGNLSAGLDWSATLFGVGPNGTAQLTVADTTMDMILAFPLRRNGKLHVSRAEVTEIGHVRVDIKGLGTGDAVSEIVLNLLTNIFKYDFANSVLETARQAVEAEIDSIDLAQLSRSLMDAASLASAT